MISHLSNHWCLPLLFGVVTRSEPLRLVIQFNGEKEKSFTLCSAIRKKALSKPSWLRILKEIAKGLMHIHQHSILHNDLRANNVVLKKRKDCNGCSLTLAKHGLPRIQSKLCLCWCLAKQLTQSNTRTSLPKLFAERLETTQSSEKSFSVNGFSTNTKIAFPSLQ